MVLVHFINAVNWTSAFLFIAVFEDLIRSLNWNGDNKFPSYTYIQQAIVNSGYYPNRNIVVRGIHVPDGFHMEILVHNSETNELDLMSRFKIYETRNGRARVEMFNLIIMSEVFQEWFMDEFQCNLPLPLMKKTGAEPQNFVAPTSTVELLAVHQPRQMMADNAAPAEENVVPAPVEEDIVPARRDPIIALTERVVALERTIADLRLALEPRF